jgi:hypothetical protein
MKILPVFGIQPGGRPSRIGGRAVLIVTPTICRWLLPTVAGEKARRWGRRPTPLLACEPSFQFQSRERIACLDMSGTQRSRMSR